MRPFPSLAPAPPQDNRLCPWPLPAPYRRPGAWPCIQCRFGPGPHRAGREHWPECRLCLLLHFFSRGASALSCLGLS